MAGTLIDMSKIKQMFRFYQMGHSNTFTLQYHDIQIT